MDFKDLQKVWNQQTNEPMYIIDQQALYRQIQHRAKQADRIAQTNEWGMMVIAVLTSVLLLWIGKDTTYQIIASVTMLGTGVYVFWQRRLRLASLNRQPHSILEELDQAIANANYLVRFAQTFAYWFLLPTAAVTIFRMAQKEVDIWCWLFILGAFLLSFALVRWELVSKHRPRKRVLEELKETLTREVG
jgi:hypothetical protein